MLHARGIPVRIFESTRALRPLGVGINVQPSAVAELALIGLLERMAEVGVKTAEVCYFNRHGQQIWREPRGMAAGYLVPQFSIHRGELQMLLMRPRWALAGPCLQPGGRRGRRYRRRRAARA
jgi:2-polyprenyl-6-methoxyphenol hydroxylase-like FAD-dependent oxidoreductase